MSVLRTITQKGGFDRGRSCPKTRICQKNILKSWRVFRPKKLWCNAPRFTTQFTTTSPRFTIKKTREKRKPPNKNHAFHHGNFFCSSKLETPLRSSPVRLELCGSSSPSSCSLLSLLWPRTRLQLLLLRTTRA